MAQACLEMSLFRLTNIIYMVGFFITNNQNQNKDTFTIDNNNKLISKSHHSQHHNIGLLEK